MKLRIRPFAREHSRIEQPAVESADDLEKIKMFVGRQIEKRRDLAIVASTLHQAQEFALLFSGGEPFDGQTGVGFVSDDEIDVADLIAHALEIAGARPGVELNGGEGL